MSVHLSDISNYILHVCVRNWIILAIFGEILHYIVEKSHQYDVSTIRVCIGKGRAPPVCVHGLMDVDIQTGVAYPMQAIGLVSIMDTGIQTWVHRYRQL